MASFQSLISEKVREQANDPIGQRLLSEYGAVFIARGGAIAPDRIIFRGETDVNEFQNRVSSRSIRFDNVKIELQTAASEHLSNAIEAARAKGLTITPRGSDSGRRSYAETESLWASRVNPALEHWIGRGKLTVDDAEKIRQLSPFEQVPAVLQLEAKGFFFAKDFSKTILHSVAPPGTSQHLSMLAFDVAEFDQPEVRRILEENFWFQTVPSDLPHFTFLGVQEGELTGLGLKRVVSSERSFWIPELEA